MIRLAVFSSVVSACRGTAKHLATVLRASLAAGQAAGTLVGAAGLHSLRALSAARGLVELLPWEPGHRAAICALSSSSGALNRLLDLVRVRSSGLTHGATPRFTPSAIHLHARCHAASSQTSSLVDVDEQCCGIPSIVSLDPCRTVICNMQHTWRVCRTLCIPSLQI